MPIYEYSRKVPYLATLEDGTKKEIWMDEVFEVLHPIAELDNPSERTLSYLRYKGEDGEEHIATKVLSLSNLLCFKGGSSISKNPKQGNDISPG